MVTLRDDLNNDWEKDNKRTKNKLDWQNLRNVNLTRRCVLTNLPISEGISTAEQKDRVIFLLNSVLHYQAKNK